MKRRTVLTALSMGALGLTGLAAARQAMANLERRDDRTPALFVGHGSPMNEGATLKKPPANGVSC